jgi:hypothetical protein
MTGKLFIALYVGLIASMVILFFTNIPVAWVLYAFVFVAVFGGVMLIDRPRLIAAGFLLTSLIPLAVGLVAVAQAWQTGTWPTAPGVITRTWHCTLTTNSSTVYSGSCLQYRYWIDDQTFEASLIDTGEIARPFQTRIPDRYRAEQHVTVYYSPADPGVSRLEADLLLQDWITTTVGALMTTLSAFTLVWILVHRADAVDVFLAGIKF